MKSRFVVKINVSICPPKKPTKVCSNVDIKICRDHVDREKLGEKIVCSGASMKMLTMDISKMNTLPENDVM
jgi:hypothetical protein